MPATDPTPAAAPAPTSPARPLLAISHHWQGLRGMAYGLQQPALIGQFRLVDITAQDLLRVDTLAALVPDIVLQPLPAVADPATQLAFRLADWVGAIQRRCRIPVSPRFFVLRLPSPDGGSSDARFHVVLPSHDGDASRLALRWLAARLQQLSGADTQAFSFGDAAGAETGLLLDQLQPLAEPGLNRFHILQAAQRLDMPVQQLNDRIHMLGTGSCARLLNSSITDSTSNIGVTLANSKSQTASLLRLAGLPGAVHEFADSVEQAIDAAERLGYPVVVKPDGLRQGLGVMSDLTSREAVASAYVAARQHAQNILVEKWADGSTHRLTVFNRRVIRIVRRVAGGVTGDGQRTIAQLVDAAGAEAGAALSVGAGSAPAVVLDAEALGLLGQYGLTPAHVPAAGERVRLRRRDNINAGGFNVELTADQVHPENLRVACDAAAVLRVDFAGVDLISTDIATSWRHNGALICEVNAMPQLGISGDPAIYDGLLTELMGGRFAIPLQVVLCAGDAALRQRCVAQLVEQDAAGAVSDRSGLWVNGQPVSRAFASGFDAALALLLRADVDRGTCVMSPDEVIAAGFPVARVDRVRVADAHGVPNEQRRALNQALAMLEIGSGSQAPRPA